MPAGDLASKYAGTLQPARSSSQDLAAKYRLKLRKTAAPPPTPPSVPRETFRADEGDQMPSVLNPPAPGGSADDRFDFTPLETGLRKVAEFPERVDEVLRTGPAVGLPFGEVGRRVGAGVIKAGLGLATTPAAVGAEAIRNVRERGVGEGLARTAVDTALSFSGIPEAYRQVRQVIDGELGREALAREFLEHPVETALPWAMVYGGAKGVLKGTEATPGIRPRMAERVEPGRSRAEQLGETVMEGLTQDVEPGVPLPTPPPPLTPEPRFERDFGFEPPADRAGQLERANGIMQASGATPQEIAKLTGQQIEDLATANRETASAQADGILDAMRRGAARRQLERPEGAERRVAPKSPPGTRALEFTETGELKPGPLKTGVLLWREGGEIRRGRYVGQAPGPADSVLLRVADEAGKDRFFQVREGETRVGFRPRPEEPAPPPPAPPSAPAGIQPQGRGVFEPGRQKWLREQAREAEARDAPLIDLIRGEGGIGYETIKRVAGKDAARDLLRSSLNQRHGRKLVSQGKGRVGADVIAEMVEARQLADFSGAANKEGALVDLLLEKAREYGGRKPALEKQWSENMAAGRTPVGDLMSGSATGKALKRGDVVRLGETEGVPADTYRVESAGPEGLKLKDGQEVTLDPFDQVAVEDVFPSKAGEVPGSSDYADTMARSKQRREYQKEIRGAQPTGEPVFRGYGREGPRNQRGEAIYSGEHGPVLGPGKYFAFEEGRAEHFGPKMEKRRYAAKGKTLKIGSDKEWVDWFQREVNRGKGVDAPGYLYPDPSGLEGAGMRGWADAVHEAIRRGGHSSVEVRIPKIGLEKARELVEKYPSAGPVEELAKQVDESLGKRIDRLFGQDQVYLPPWSEGAKIPPEAPSAGTVGHPIGTKGGGTVGHPMEAEPRQRRGGHPPVPAGMDLPERVRVALAPGAKPISPHHVKEFLERKLQVPIRQGLHRNLGKSAAGFFKIKPEAIRIWKEKDLPVIAHEVGHFLDKVLGLNVARRAKNVYRRGVDVSGLTKEQIRAMGKELVAAGKRLYGSRRPYGGYASEGVAEFHKFLLTDPKRAAAEFPTYFGEYMNRMKKFPEIVEALDQARDMIVRMEKQPASAEILGQMSIGENRARPMTLERILNQTFDRFESLRKYTQEMRKTNPNSPHDAYDAAMLHSGWVGKVNEMLFKRAIDHAGNTVGPGLKQILGPVRQNLDDLRVLLAAKHTLEHVPKGKETGISVQAAKEGMAELKKLPHYEALEEASRQIYQWNDHLLDYAVDAGLLTKEARKAMREMYQAYVPWFRVMDMPESTPGTGMFASMFKRFKGSQRRAIDPLENMVNNAFALVNRADSNAVRLELLKQARETEGAGRWVEEVPMAKVADKVPVEKAIEQLFQMGVEFPEGFLENLPPEYLKQAVLSFRPSVMRSMQKGMVPVMENGKFRAMIVKPEELYRSLLSMDKESVNAFVKIAAVPARTLRAGATWANLAFTTSNWLKDQWTLYNQSDYGALPVIDSLRAMRSIVGDRPAFKEYRTSGAMQATLSSWDRNYAGDVLHKILDGRRPPPATGPLMRRIYKLGNKIGAVNPLEAVRRLNEIVETSSRLPEYELARRKVGRLESRVRGILTGTKLENMRESQPIAKAARAAQEVTVNFSRVGNSMRALNMISAFYNANVQAIAKTGRVVREHPVRTTARVIASITVPSMILHAINADDPEYKAMPSWRKDLFWNVPTGEGERHGWISIPKPHLLGLLGGSAVERGMDYLHDHDPEGFKDLSARVLQAATPGTYGFPTPTFITALGEWWANKSAWSGQPTSPPYKENMPPEYRYGPRTSPTMKDLAQKGADLGVPFSPAKAEQFVRSTTGGVGGGVLSAADMAGRATGAFPPAPASEVSPFAPEKLPVVSRFFYRRPPSPEGPTSDEYDRYVKGEALLSTFKTLFREGTPAEQERFMQRHGDDLENYLEEARELRGRVRSQQKLRRAMGAEGAE